MSLHDYFATCARGLEGVLAKEIERLHGTDVGPSRGGVRFRGPRDLVYRANLWLRTAIRILRPLLKARVETPDDLYQAVQTLNWGEYLTADHTLAVDANVRDSAITHSQYAAQRTKDAICDQFLARLGRRPSVDLTRPMVKINLHLYRNDLVLSLDSSGDSLHKRGYRPIQSRAPLNEALAAGILLLAGWDGAVPFADPMCGSGTLPIEAGWIALNRPPGLTRKRFGFQGWLDHDLRLWTEIRDQARRQVRTRLPAPIQGSDLRRDVIHMARESARAAGVGHLLSFGVRNIDQFQPPAGGPGVIVVNPPYGERLGEERELQDLYRRLGKMLREKAAGWRAFVFTGNPALEECLGMIPRRAIPLFNGRIPCRLLCFEPS